MLTHLPQVDGLRAVAILGVMLAHFLPRNARVLDFGLFGVSIFFCLSAYLITTSLLTIRDQRSGCTGRLSFVSSINADGSDSQFRCMCASRAGLFSTSILCGPPGHGMRCI